MKRYLYRLFITSLLTLTLMFTGCVDEIGKDIDDQVSAQDCLIFDLDISGAITRGTQDSPGEDNYNENKFSSVAIYLYEEDSAEETSKPLLQQNLTPTLSGSQYSARLSLSSLKSLIDEKGDEGLSLTVYAVANCSNLNDLETPTIQDLKKFTTKTDEFRSDEAPSSFVMTNFATPTKITLKFTESSVTGKLTFRRVAAKIRTAMKVAKAIYQKEETSIIPETDEEGQSLETEGYLKWTPDYNSMRLYISNGVRTARLDGNVSELSLTDSSNSDDSDYYSVVTSGSKDDNSDFNYSRPLSSHDDSVLSGNENEEEKDAQYLYYNSLPYYSYPNEWAETVTESHQTIMTIVVPWENKSNGETTYKPTYYSIPVSNVDKATNLGKIVSNAYYYLRANINMMGSETPESPMPVDMECEIANWGTADDTEVSLRPLRFLIFSQNEFVSYNETSITIPFSSSHECKVEACKGTFYQFTNSKDRYGDALERYFDEKTTWNESGSIKGFDSSGKVKFYDYEIDNINNTLTFKHDFYSIFNIPSAQTSDGQGPITIGNINGPYDRPNRTEGRNSRNKLYSQVEIELKVRHDTGQDIDAGYEETVYITFYPAIYVTTEYIEPDGSPLYESVNRSNRNGWLLVNGYGYNDNNGNNSTGYLGQISNDEPESNRSKCMTTFTVTTLDEEESQIWTIGDPRTYFINNEMTNDSMQNDSEDHTQTWTDYGGPYDGSQTTRHTDGEKNTARVVWEYYKGSDWILNWSGGSWEAKKDYWTDSQHLEDGSEDPQYHRTLSYYYPTSEFEEKSHFIAPKFTAVSYHTRAASVTREQARRRCAALQQYGYPAGRFRLPTTAEVEIMRAIQNSGVTHDIFGATPFWCAQGYTSGSVATDGHVSVTSTNSTTTTHWVRCIYDTWYWEQVDADGNEGLNRIPNNGETFTINGETVTASNRELWKYFTWGDRPKESVLTRGENPVQSFMQSHSKGNYVVIRDKESVRLEKMK